MLTLYNDEDYEVLSDREHYLKEDEEGDFYGKG